MLPLIRIDLSEQLEPGQYVEIRDPRALPWGTQREIATIMKDETVDSQLDAIERMVLILVKGMNLNDEDGNPIALPLDTAKVRQMPGPAVEAVAAKFAEVRSKGADLPKK